jgi:hypothetical protein
MEQLDFVVGSEVHSVVAITNITFVCQGGVVYCVGDA